MWRRLIGSLLALALIPLMGEAAPGGCERLLVPAPPFEGRQAPAADAGNAVDIGPSPGGTRDILFVTSGNTLTAYELRSGTPRWGVNTGVPDGGVFIVPDRGRAVVLVAGAQTEAYDTVTGAPLWSMPGYPSLSRSSVDVHQQMYTNRLAYPYGPPRCSASSAPLIAISAPAGPTTAISLVESRTGRVCWTRNEQCENHQVAAFLPKGDGTYDVITRSHDGCTMKRLAWQNPDRVIWERSGFQYQTSVPVPDVTGDGLYDLFTRANYYDDMYWLDGATGATIQSDSYGSFDVLGATVVRGADGCSSDIICAAQNSSDGGIRRYRNCSDFGVVWDCDATYRNQTLRGILKRADGGFTVVSGWRHQGRSVAVDLETGATLWDDVPCYDQDAHPVGVSDLTGDGSEDVLSPSPTDGLVRLYDGVTGKEQTWFAPIESGTGRIGVWVGGNLEAECVPSQVTPQDNAILDNGCTDGSDVIAWDFEWTDCEGADAYHLHVQHPGSTFPVIDISTLTESSYHYDCSGCYVADQNRFDWRWKVRAMIDGQWAEWSPERTFDVEPLNTDCLSDWRCYPDLPAPQLLVTGTEDYFVNGQWWTRYWLSVTNRSVFPAELFEPAPALPPCGLNTNASRTWVRIYDQDDSYIYGFCALNSPDSLGRIWFARPRGQSPPPFVYVTLNDRYCGITYTSNLASTN